MNKLHNNSIGSFLLIASIFLLLVWPSQAASANSSQTKPRSKPQDKPQIKKPSPESGNKALPEAVIDNPKFDYGEAFIGEEIEHVFTVRNLGSATLELSQGGPVGAIERREPDALLRRVLLASINPSLSAGLTPVPAAMRAAPS